MIQAHYPQEEDPYDDEWDEEDEIIEAGVDGRPDAEREAEEAKESMLQLSCCAGNFNMLMPA